MPEHVSCRFSRQIRMRTHEEVQHGDEAAPAAEKDGPTEFAHCLPVACSP